MSDARHFAGLVSGMLLEICWKSGLVLLGWAGVDYLLLWRKSEGDLKMSRQDLKDEMKQTEGNPAEQGQDPQAPAAIPPQADAQGRRDGNGRDHQSDPLCGRAAL